MIRVLIVAPSPVVRMGLETLIGSSPGTALAGAFADLAPVEALRPDVVLAAVSVSELPAATDGAAPAYVLIGAESDAGWSAEAVRAGVRALLPREASAAQILAAVEAAAQGLAVVDPADLEQLAGGGATASALPDAPALTGRELEVLGMMAEGAANKTIAWKLNISEHTVKFHVASILAKLAAGSRTEAVTTGIRRGLILV